MFCFGWTFAQDPVTITYWTDPNMAAPANHPEFTSLGEYEQWQAEQFMEMHPHVTIEVQGLDWPDLPKKVPAAIASGNPPDILKDYLGRTSGYGFEEVTVDLFEYLTEEEIADIQPGLIDLYTINGRLHAMPTYFWSHHMIVNKALFDQAGLGDMIPMDDRDWTFDEFLEAMRAIKAADVGLNSRLPYKLLLSKATMTFTRSYGAQVVMFGIQTAHLRSQMQIPLQASSLLIAFTKKV